MVYQFLVCGNPVSSYVCFIIFVMEAIKKLPSDVTTLQKVSPSIKNLLIIAREKHIIGEFFLMKIIRNM